MKCVALILAGGIGARMGIKTPKQFIEINNKPIIIHTLNIFHKNKNIEKIYISCLETHKSYLRNLLKEYKLENKVLIVDNGGGATGIESTYNGIKKINEDYKAKKNVFVIIHDANRPFVKQELLDTLMHEAKEKGNVVTALQSTDLIFKRKSNENSFESNLGKESLYRIQKPECYKLNDLKNIYEYCFNNNKTNYVATCDMFLDNNQKIYFINGNQENIKITYKTDLKLAEEILKEGEKNE